MWNISVETLGTMALENNLLTGFEQNLGVLPGAAIRILDLSRNLLQGSLPVPPQAHSFIASNVTDCPEKYHH